MIKKLREMLVDIMLQVGIRFNMQGSQYIIEAVCEIVTHPRSKLDMTKFLYPWLGEKFGKAPAAIDRDIRTVIYKAFTSGKLVKINEIFGFEIFTKFDKPSNSEFIMLLATKVPSMLQNRL